MFVKGNKMFFLRILFVLVSSLSLLLNSGCVSPESYTPPQKKMSKQTSGTPEKITPPPEPIEKQSLPVIAEDIDPDEALIEEQIADEDIEKDPPNEDNDRVILTEQELIDSALEYCQASNEFWDKGDLEGAIDCLDKAYSITLKINNSSNPEIMQEKEDLRMTISKRILEVYTSRYTVANGTHKAIPLDMNEYVQKEINSFKGKERKWFLKVYARSGKYRPAIVKELKKAGLPEELSWLPLIESGFSTKAFSSARAMGMWQFIASTGYKFGLKRNTWFDERRDPEKSTKAAIAYLSELHQIFGEWKTALASYNCGEARVLRVIKSQKINYMDDFWDLFQKLPRETARYVPRFFAVLHILDNPGAYGFELPELEEELVYEKVTVKKQMSLKDLAKEIDIPYTLLHELNPALFQSVTPKIDYELKVPAGKAEILTAKLDDVPTYYPPVPAYVIHRVRSGDSLSVIADKYNTSINSIMSLNGLKSKNYLRAGWKLKVPTGKYTARTYTAPSETPTKYVVQKGDSLWKIANSFGTTVKSIKTANNLISSNLRIGQTLMLSKEPSATKTGENQEYIVKRGDSPYLIAKKYSMNLYDFMKINNLNAKTTIYPGQVVKVVPR